MTPVEPLKRGYLLYSVVLSKTLRVAVLRGMTRPSLRIIIYILAAVVAFYIRDMKRKLHNVLDC